jgi:hypothetical protein
VEVLHPNRRLILSGESQFIPLYCWIGVRYRWFGDEICLPQGAKMKTAKTNFAAVSAVAIGLAAGPVSADPLDDILYPADANGFFPLSAFWIRLSAPSPEQFSRLNWNRNTAG